MLLPSLPTFPEGLSQLDDESFEKIARKVLVHLPSTSSSENLRNSENLALSRDVGLSLEDVEKLVVFLQDLWRHLIYHRLTGEPLLKVLKSCLIPSGYIEIDHEHLVLGWAKYFHSFCTTNCIEQKPCKGHFMEYMGSNCQQSTDGKRRRSRCSIEYFN
ncbi:hypothetical protein KIN20_029435 [Parelaphostrongylus tenuis]|uniref:Uncharacterized protein n=1 Tax=Parelaphostrongylus tenuis TaxID=148309 RepID=A0AAD5R2H9_PARTN|nr:hypothetical protein KIN20_029435 [Parelaphostrongylus tenuis]